MNEKLARVIMKRPCPACGTAPRLRIERMEHPPNDECSGCRRFVASCSPLCALRAEGRAASAYMALVMWHDAAGLGEP